MAFSKTHVRDIALAYLELKDFGRVSSLDDYMAPRDFFKRDQKFIQAEVQKILIDRQQSLLKKTIKEGAASPVPSLSVLGWGRHEKRLDQTLSGLNK